MMLPSPVPSGSMCFMFDLLDFLVEGMPESHLVVENTLISRCILTEM